MAQAKTNQIWVSHKVNTFAVISCTHCSDGICKSQTFLMLFLNSTWHLRYRIQKEYTKRAAVWRVDVSADQCRRRAPDLHSVRLLNIMSDWSTQLWHITTNILTLIHSLNIFFVNPKFHLMVESWNDRNYLYSVYFSTVGIRVATVSWVTSTV